MMSRAELQGVIGREPKPGHHVLSVYLDVQQSQASRLARGFEPALRGMLRAAGLQVRTEEDRKAFDASAERVLRFVVDYNKPGAPSLVMFCDATEPFFWSREFRVPVRNVVHWAEAPHGRPLLELMDDHECYCVALTDRGRARIFTVWLGEIEEHARAMASDPVCRSRKVGADQMRSQAGVQRRAEHHSHWHLKHVAMVADAILNTHAFDRLVLAGPVEATSELHRLLPRRLRPRLAPAIPLAIEASEQQVLDAVLKLEQVVERDAEMQMVHEVTVTAGKNPQAAVVGDEATLKALQAGRVWKLVYADGFAAGGGQCKGCGALFVDRRATCGYCGAEVEAVDDVTDRLVERAVASDARVRIARAAAAEQLRKHGGIGAFLRF